MFVVPRGGWESQPAYRPNIDRETDLVAAIGVRPSHHAGVVKTCPRKGLASFRRMAVLNLSTSFRSLIRQGLDEAAKKGCERPVVILIELESAKARRLGGALLGRSIGGERTRQDCPVLCCFAAAADTVKILKRDGRIGCSALAKVIEDYSGHLCALHLPDDLIEGFPREPDLWALQLAEEGLGAVGMVGNDVCFHGFFGYDSIEMYVNPLRFSPFDYMRVCDS